MARDTRDRLVRAAHDLFYREGFHAVGLDRILREVGVTKTTFYNHFSCKDDLVLEALRWHDRWWQDTFRALLRKHGGDSPRGQLLAIPDALEETYAMAPFNGCFFVNVCAEFPSPTDPAHILAAEHKKAMEDLLREIAGYAGVQDTESFAREIAMVLEGSYVTEQVSPGRGAAAVARRIIPMIVERHLT